MAPAVRAYARTVSERGTLRWTVGTACVSASREFSVRLTSTMPMPPARLTSWDFSARALNPRSQTTILLSTLTGSSVPARQTDDRATDTPDLLTRDALTSGAGPMLENTVVLMPAYFAPLPSTTVPPYGATVLVATVVSHGATCSTVDGPGPLLPAAVATKTPALAADRKARSTGSARSSLLLIE